VAHRTNWMHRLRNLLPFRSVLRYFLFNMYDVVEFDLAKPEADGAAGRGLGSGRGS